MEAVPRPGQSGAVESWNVTLRGRFAFFHGRPFLPFSLFAQFLSSRGPIGTMTVWNPPSHPTPSTIG